MLQVILGFCILLGIFLVGLVISVVIEEEITFFSCMGIGFGVIIFLAICIVICYAIGSIFIP